MKVPKVGKGHLLAEGANESNEVRYHGKHRERSTSPSDQEAMCSKLRLNKENINVAHCLSTPNQYPKKGHGSITKPWLMYPESCQVHRFEVRCRRCFERSNASRRLTCLSTLIEGQSAALLGSEELGLPLRGTWVSSSNKRKASQWAGQFYFLERSLESVTSRRKDSTPMTLYKGSDSGNCYK